MAKQLKTSLKKDHKSVSTQEYAQLLVEIKRHIKTAQVKAIFAANKELLKLYWFIGQTLVRKQQEHGWGSNVIEKLAQDLQNEFSGLGGFSRANVFKMRSWYLAYEKVSQAVRQFDDLPTFSIPWGHNVILVTKLKDTDQRLWYAQKAVEHGWSRTMLEHWIKVDLFQREGKAITNFKDRLPISDSDIAQQSFKDPYIFDFLTLHKDYVEHDLEQGLIDNVQKLLLEMGKGFALVGRQYHIQVSDHDYYIDLLFYNFKLRCFVVVELKACEFIPEHAGKLNFYLSVVDDLVRGPEDNKTIGLLLCKTKNNFTAEYALRDINKPMGVAGYETEILKRLPKDLKSTLPTVEEIEAEFKKNEILSEESSPRKTVKRKPRSKT